MVLSSIAATGGNPGTDVGAGGGLAIRNPLAAVPVSAALANSDVAWRLEASPKALPPRRVRSVGLAIASVHSQTFPPWSKVALGLGEVG